jgi:hypothetical protein
VKGYGVADGVLIALATAAVLTVLLVALQVPAAYFWTLAVGSAVLLAAGVYFGGKVGRNLVDGAFLRSWLRLSLLLVVVCSAVAAPVLHTQRKVAPGETFVDPTPNVVETAKLDRDKCAELKDALASFQDNLPTAQGHGLSGEWEALNTRNSINRCSLEPELEKAASRLISKSADVATTTDKKVALEDLKKELVVTPAAPIPDPETKVAEQPAWATAPARMPDVFDPLPAATPEPTPSPGEEDDETFLESIVQLVASLAFGSTTVTSQEIKGAIRSTSNGQGDSLTALEEKMANEYQSEALRTAVRLYAHGLNDPEKKKRLHDVLDNKPETQLCHYVLSRLPDAPDPEVLKKIAPVADVEATIEKLPQGEWVTVVAKVRACVHDQDRPNYERYEPVFQSLNSIRSQVR